MLHSCISRAARLLAAAASVLLLAHLHAAQVTFQVEVNYVDIDAVVTDERGTVPV
jgi:hypothetical protein